MKKNPFLLIVFLLSLFACKKPEPVSPATKIEGRVMDRGTEIPITNVRVRCLEITYNGFLTNPSKRVIESVQSDSNGRFSFSFQWIDPSKDYEVDVIPDLEKYYILPYVQGKTVRGQTNKINLLMNPYAWVKYRIRNINPFNNKDTIRTSPGVYIGMNIDVTAFEKTLKIWDKPDSIGWLVTKNNIMTRYNKPITLIPRDTVAFEINY
ncbi:MAG: carboxypeptidase regulatory-like domain-containing protein [Saprospiraceae bacterium]|nr:carboxypeptidase regulatory-like domain-containing protein [Saprospiraceae bacterium]